MVFINVNYNYHSLVYDSAVGLHIFLVKLSQDLLKAFRNGEMPKSYHFKKKKKKKEA